MAIIRTASVYVVPVAWSTGVDSAAPIYEGGSVCLFSASSGEPLPTSTYFGGRGRTSVILNEVDYMVKDS